MTWDALSFWAMVGFFTTHELDAIRKHEWRVLPLTSFLPDKAGEAVFLWMHVPLFAVVAWIATSGVASLGAILLSGFAAVHVALHWLFRRHPAYEFNTLESWSLIVGAGVAGALHILLVVA